MNPQAPLMDLPPELEGATLNFSILWGIFRKYARQILGGTVAVGVIVGLVSLFIWPKTYEAKAVILPPTEELLGGSLQFIKGLVPGLSGSATPTEVVLAMFQSDRVSWDIIQKFRLDTLWNKTHREDLLKEAHKRLHVGVDLQLGTIEVQFKARDPRLAAQITNAYIQVVEALNDSLKISPIKPFLKVLDYAHPPKKKSSPKTTLNVLLSMILAWTVLWGWGVFREIRNPWVQTPLDVQRISADLPLVRYQTGADLPNITHALAKALRPGDRVLVAWFEGLSEEEVRGTIQQAWEPVGMEFAVERVEGLREGHESLPSQGDSRVTFVFGGPLPKHSPAVFALHAVHKVILFIVPGKTLRQDLKDFLVSAYEAKAMPIACILWERS